jgi:amino acid permease
MAGAILALGIAGLALMIPGYNHVQQTVSEIGEIGSPARFPFAVLLCCVAACILVFAATVRYRSVEAGHSQLAAY